MPPFEFGCCTQIPDGQSGGRPLPKEQQKPLGPNYRARPAGMAPLFAGPSPAVEQDLYAALGGHSVWRGMRQLEVDLSRQGVRFAVEEPRDLSARALHLYEEIRQRQLV